ncbi:MULTISPECIES: general stress protein [Erwiniaceae]|uniref:general stress protein n=1 Tax=Erwinia sp. S59 TaxID=2769340 RepID=UPI001F0B2EEE|nr:general stress protein [Pantoea rwandensis]
MTTTSRRGGAGNFAADPSLASEASSKGAAASDGNFKNCPDRARVAARGPKPEFN